jgi:hypothetical protein
MSPGKQTMRILRVEFEAGPERWSAIGGGGSVDEAIAFARESLPTGCRWRAVCWSDLYGD